MWAVEAGPQRSDERLDRLLVLGRLDDCDHPFDMDAVAGEGGQLSDRNRTPGIAVDGIGAIEARRRSVVEGQLDLLTLDSEGVVFAGGLGRHPLDYADAGDNDAPRAQLV